MTDLATLPLAEAAIIARDGGARALLEACLTRLDAANPTINATIWLDREGARAHADTADRTPQERTPPERPLHGVPLAHKDMYYQAGRPTTCGSAIRRDFVPSITATVLTRLAQAGSFAFAGLNMAEFAQNPSGHNRAFGDACNPWNPAYITGGSSSGSGAAVAVGATAASLGSDTGGSIRLPASACGVTGLKPTQTRVSRHGVMPLSFSTDTVGPLARSAACCALILQIIAGHDKADPTSTRRLVPDYVAALNGDISGLRIGIPIDPLHAAAAPEIQIAIEAACRVLQDRGATLIRLPLPLMDAVSAYTGVISRVEGAAIHAQFLRYRSQDYAPHLSARLFAGLAIPGAYYVEALSRRGPILRAFAAEVFAKVDLLALPTIPTLLPTRAATDVDAFAAGETGPEVVSVFNALSANCRPFNYLGLPAISLPCGFDPNGLPIGLQLVARPFDEQGLLRAADAYQRDTDWHERRPNPG
jgi:aspartyl-tRNA(Asn)/glutamyl-tRNA(Gln) amidotransferase subunit A